ncbi:LysR family transcriptional regulator [Salinicola avicenniae]|uniref:LysR family transcriptional regulator n=1 Tax=Salinicola avicenniae TaxID=2916836 RepID=UPI0020746024|nr:MULTISPECIES: LysR family transcriptional regulator [unclassified Salinicola]
MQREDLSDLLAFLAVAEAGSFTKAAAGLGTSQSSLSHTLRRLEQRLGIRLLARTTRSVSPTEAGERLLETLKPSIADIDARLQVLSNLRDNPAGTVRLTAGEHGARSVLWPALERLLPDHPNIQVEVSLNEGLVDIVAGRFDAGLRLGEQIDRDMIAIPVGPALRMAVVGSPTYFADREPPTTPRELTHHDCINLRLPTRGGLYAWEFEQEGREVNVRVEGSLIFNTPSMMAEAATRGFGLAYVMEDEVAERLHRGELVRVLEDWCPPFPGYHLYYPGRRELSPALSALVDALKHDTIAGR